MGKHSSLSCNKCMKQMRSDNFKRHLFSCKGIRQQERNCPLCQKRILRKNMLRHLQVKHNEIFFNEKQIMLRQKCRRYGLSVINLEKMSFQERIYEIVKMNCRAICGNYLPWRIIGWQWKAVLQRLKKHYDFDPKDYLKKAQEIEMLPLGFYYKRWINIWDIAADPFYGSLLTKKPIDMFNDYGHKFPQKLFKKAKIFQKIYNKKDQNKTQETYNELDQDFLDLKKQETFQQPYRLIKKYKKIIKRQQPSKYSVY